MTELLLDPDILYWVVIPLFLLMVAAGMLRHNVMRLLQNDKQPIPAVAQRTKNTIRHMQRIRSAAAAAMMTSAKWQARKLAYMEYLQLEVVWCEQEKEKEETGAAGADDDPMAALMGGANPLSMMKGNMAFMVQNMVRFSI
jgi:hypothetical protein